MKELKLSPPWNTFVSELKALFGEDPDIKIVYDEDAYEVKLYVEDEAKAEALTQLIPEQRIYGNVALKVTIVPANSQDENGADLVEAAFKGNPVLKEVLRLKTPFGEYDYAIFRKEVVQFYNDDLTDPHGNESTLFEDIARDVFGDTGVFFCTDSEKAGKPLGEWP